MTPAEEEKFLDQLLDDLDNDSLVLPSMPEIAIKARNTLEDENASLRDVANVISSDPALSARIIQIANSPLLRTQEPITTIENAVSRMGGSMVRNLVISLIMKQMFLAPNKEAETLMQELWQHSIQTAAIASVMAEKFTSLKPDEALLAGLVHDIGALPIIGRLEEYPELLQDRASLARIISSAHCTIGSEILSRWHFPDPLIEVAREHEDLQHESSTGIDYTGLIIVANLQSHIGTDHPHLDKEWSKIPAFKQLGISPSFDIMFEEELKEKFAAIKESLCN